MEVTFSEGGRYKFACYRLTYGESKSPDRIAKIKADLASKGKDGYSIAITYDASPTPPTWDTFANSLLCLDGRLEMWKLMQENWPHHKAVEAQKGVSKMSTSYFIFTEVLTNDQWHCINPQVMKLLPIEQLILVPTLRSDSRYQFEKAYRQLECDGHPFTVDEMSRNLQASVNDWLTPEDSVRIAVCYDDILKLLNTSGKEHSAFALRSEVAAFQNGESDNILDFVSVDEYRKMEDELKKAYQYFEWNDRSGAYRYYEEIQKKVAAQLDFRLLCPVTAGQEKFQRITTIPIRNWIPCLMAGERLLGSKCVKISVRNWYVPSISTNTALPRSRRNMERSVGMTLAVQSECFVTSSPNMSAYLRELASDVGTLQQRLLLAGSVPTVTLVLAKSVMPRDLFLLRNGSVEAEMRLHQKGL